MFGDDEADRAVTGHQAAGIVDFLEFVGRTGLDSDVLRRDSRVLQQILAHIVGVDEPRLSLFPARSLHLNHTDGPDVDAGFGFVAPRRGLEAFAVFDRLQQRALPVAARPVANVQVELDHLLRVELAAEDLDEHVRALDRSCRELDDHAGIEAFQGCLGTGAVRLVPLVEDDQRLEHPNRVAERCLDVAPPESRRLLERVQIGVIPK